MNLGKTALLVLFCGLFAQSAALAESKYWQEFKEFRDNPSHKLVFDKEANGDVRHIAKNLANAKEVGHLGRFIRPLIGMVGGVIISKETMPKLHNYIDTLCKQNRIDTPVIAVTQHKGIFNAAAQKLLMTSGAIFVGQDLLKELKNEEIEAVIAHEIGHIYHNHINKMILTSWARLFVIYQLCKNGILTQKQGIYLHLFCPLLLIGKKFERQADEFACRAGKANGLIGFFEHLEKMMDKEDADFDALYEALKKDSSKIDYQDHQDIWLQYYLAKGMHKIGRAMKWVYHNTPFGPHPSNEERLDNAKRALAQQGASAA